MKAKMAWKSSHHSSVLVQLVSTSKLLCSLQHLCGERTASWSSADELARRRPLPGRGKQSFTPLLCFFSKSWGGGGVLAVGSLWSSVMPPIAGPATASRADKRVSARIYISVSVIGRLGGEWLVGPLSVCLSLSLSVY
ncbi:hypothetical protein SORBI_3006G057100 [Sorghum bicolor]|uniref:Uncharacterized protein n=1 Tax=Sorghum bicolor TaxID=4558 RepID=C5YF77_SORBI|nr:hypothetical protein SORBI_3006G057100 [Sorghum bicolor]